MIEEEADHKWVLNLVFKFVLCFFLAYFTYFILRILYFNFRGVSSKEEKEFEAWSSSIEKEFSTFMTEETPARKNGQVNQVYQIESKSLAIDVEMNTTNNELAMFRPNSLLEFCIAENLSAICICYIVVDFLLICLCATLLIFIVVFYIVRTKYEEHFVAKRPMTCKECVKHWRPKVFALEFEPGDLEQTKWREVQELKEQCSEKDNQEHKITIDYETKSAEKSSKDIICY